ncbi:MAG: hypothetical protein ACI4MY_01275 [Christensenellales bacterium]
MASRSKKKAKNVATSGELAMSPRLIEARKTLQKVHTSFPYIVIVVTVLILVCLCLPVTGINATIDLSDAGGEGVYNASTSVNVVSLLFASVGFGEGGWIYFLASGFSGSGSNDAINQSIADYIESNFTTAQRAMLDQVMDLQHAVAFIFAALWVVVAVVGAIGASKKKSCSLLIGICALFFGLSLAELITLMVISLQGMAGSSFVTGVGAYALPIVLLGALVVLIKWQKTFVEATKTIREEEKR